MAARMPARGSSPDEDDYLIDEPVDEFRKGPDEWKEVAVRQVAMFRYLAEMPPARIIGGEDEDDEPKPASVHLPPGGQMQ